MKMTLSVLLMALTLGAQTTLTVDESDLPKDVAERLKKKQAMKEITDKVSSAGEWMAIGKAVGIATDGALSAITVNAEKFADTRVGSFLMFIVAWKVIGYPVIQITIGIPLLMSGLLTIFWSYRKRCIARRELIEDTKESGKKWKVIDPERGGEFSGPTAHVVVAFAWSAMCCLIMFIH